MAETLTPGTLVVYIEDATDTPPVCFPPLRGMTAEVLGHANGTVLAFADGSVLSHVWERHMVQVPEAQQCLTLAQRHALA